MTPSSTVPSRLLMTVAFTISALLLGIIGAVAAGTGTVAPPPKIAFVTTNANVAPDALTVGPMAGRLGAPLFITSSNNLNDDVKAALVAYDADLIIVAGGPNTVTDGVLAQISAATGLAIKDIADTPADGIVRVAGSGRDQTAVALSDLIAKYNPKFLPTDATAADADLLDGKDSTEFAPAAHDHRETVTGYDTCSAAGFKGLDHNDETLMDSTYGSSGWSGRAVSVATATTRLACDLALPHGATVTGFTAAVLDTSDTSDVSYCRLTRTSTANNTPQVQMATTPGTTGTTPGLQTLTAPTITNPLIDNSAYSYFAECELGPDLFVALAGATVEYQMLGLPNT